MLADYELSLLNWNYLKLKDWMRIWRNLHEEITKKEFWFIVMNWLTGCSSRAFSFLGVPVK